MLDCALDNENIEVVTIIQGRCQGDQENQFESEKCQLVCTQIYKPICGTDQKTYSNKCMMDMAACMEDKWIDVMHWEACETDKLMHSGKTVIKKQ